MNAPTMDEAPQVSVVIPNLNGATDRDGVKHLDVILSTLEEQSFRDFDVTVVDNGSEDGSVEYLRERWPDVHVVALSRNMGFPTAVNRGIEASSGPYIALLNTDVELTPDWIERLVGELDRDSELGFATGKVMHFDDRDVFEQAGQDLYTCGRFYPHGMNERDEGQYDTGREIPIATAAAVMYRRAAVEAAGGFDDDYFLYCEDSDLCLRMILRGFRGLYVPEPRAFHMGGGTVGQSNFSHFQIVRNALVTTLKDFPARTLLRSLPKLVLFQGHQLVVARNNGYLGTMLRAYLSFIRAIPGTLRKRRRLRPAARDSQRLESLLLHDYPLPTRFPRLARASVPTA